MRWLYSGPWGTYDPSLDSNKAAIQIAKLWILGDKLGSPGFSELAMDRLIPMFRKAIWISPGFVHLIFNNCPTSSKLCRFATIQFIMNTMERDLDGEWQDVDAGLSKNESFASEVARIMPSVNRYLARWIAIDTSFDDTDLETYVERMELLLDRNPTETDVRMIDEEPDKEED